MPDILLINPYAPEFINMVNSLKIGRGIPIALSTFSWRADINKIRHSLS